MPPHAMSRISGPAFVTPGRRNAAVLAGQILEVRTAGNTIAAAIAEAIVALALQYVVFVFDGDDDRDAVAIENEPATDEIMFFIRESAHDTSFIPAFPPGEPGKMVPVMKREA